MNKANAFTHPSKKNPLKRHIGLLKDKTYWCIGKGGEKFVKYYSGQQFEFMKLPTVLIKDPKYKYISEKAKIVFAICLNKAELSIKNGWIDKYSKIFIYYKIEKVMEDVNCSNKTALNIISELEEVGLIEKYRQGLGKPNKIYVKDFMKS